MASGARHGIYYVPEVTRGTTPPTPTLTPLRNTGTTLALSKEALQSNESRPDRMVADMRHGARQVAGDINFELAFVAHEDMMEAALMGTWEADGGGLGIDRLKVGTQRRYFTIIRDFADLEDGNKYMRYTGCEVNTMEMRVNANAIVTGRFGIIGMDLFSEASLPTGSVVGDAPSGRFVDSFSGQLLEAGQPLAVLTEITSTVENNLEARYVVGQKTSIKPSVGRANVNLNITAFFESMDLLNKFINETESSISYDLPDPDGNIYRFTYPRVKYNGGQPDTEGDGPITLAMPVVALYDETTGTNFYIDRIPA